MKKTSLAVLMLATIASSPTYAEPVAGGFFDGDTTVKGIYQRYSSGDAALRREIAGVLVGVQLGFVYAEMAMQAQHLPGPLCSPANPQAVGSSMRPPEKIISYFGTIRDTDDGKDEATREVAQIMHDLIKCDQPGK